MDEIDSGNLEVRDYVIPLVGPWRAAYLPHGWIARPKSESTVLDAVENLSRENFTHQVHNIGAFDADGNMPAEAYAGLDEWVSVSRSAATPQDVIAWVSGSETDHVNQPTTHANIAFWLEWAVDEFGLDGVFLDLEPFSADNESYIRLLDAIRTELPDTWIGVAAPAPASRWSTEFIRQVSLRADALSPMLYDSGIDSADEYEQWASDALTRYASAIAQSASLVPSLPAYSANRWHDPAVENIGTAGEAIASVGGVDGAAVYWWWEFEEADRGWWAALTPRSL